ncbi:MAG: ribbon-helix-helix protein, CopG family [Cyanobacteria bacterium SZAS LIN-3]|nr:ribbon-helix-helix protein, CopG family [Cyanobacteria bacterium SZAS LIN-3]
MVETKKRVFKPTLETKVTREDFQRVDLMAKAEGKTKSELVREALLWYLDHKAEIANKPRESETVLAIKEMTNRVCGMLARQGAVVGTLYELTWMGLPNEAAKRQFESAANTAKQKMRKRLDADEKRIAEKLGEIVRPSP